MSPPPHMTAGRPWPMGATPDGDGVNFAVFSAHATRIEVCLFDAAGRESARLPLPESEGHVWFGRVPGLGPGAAYGLRAHGPWAPEAGHRFNPAKLLIDPHAQALGGPLRWHPAMQGTAADGGPDPSDSAAVVPRALVLPPPAPAPRPPRPLRPLAETVIYEGHVKGLTMRLPGVAHPGSFAALGAEPFVAHLRALGVTALELLPVQAFIDDRHLVERGLTNFWGYQPVAWCAPEPRYLAGGGPETLRAAIDRLHEAGIEVILDVVYNHSGEGGADGPILSLRGLDNASYYRHGPGGVAVDDTGCGNTLNTEHPAVIALVAASLRHWAEVYGVDGFRFDLAATLGRRASGFDANAPLLAVLRADPLLSRLRLIAEPWDLGPGGYRLGAFGHPFLEWNDRFRDGLRRFWRGDPGAAPDLAAAVAGSAAEFDHSGRAATSSVNFVAAHDGFTLEDLVSYREKHNEANGEGNRDGHAANFSDNLGVEGPSPDPAVRAARDRRKRAMLATLFLSQGTPMLLAGDELGRTQGGNNNAYCQDNPTTWLDWAGADAALLAFTRRLIAFRRAHPVLRQPRFLHSRERERDGMRDLLWWHETGRPMDYPDWQAPARRCLCVEVRMAAGTPPFAEQETALFLVLNAGGALSVHLPRLPDGRHWARALDSADPDAPPLALNGAPLAVAAQSVVALVQEPAA